ncbi:YybH family protein [Litorihabitans aurantiacus]|uniref:SnoaL-like domain-containing protein n=1 Tax=Litorihabitans aurantiacus TaxID=1930061 RepID=A0AA37XGC3_9MICO|nr:nuclear transport factor 2 family protein [Litorihabitans aurantiacus]GMA32820.1 hypothetical protein GCM10025875_28120 [Litorihabitans aurantiacus]
MTSTHSRDDVARAVDGFARTYGQAAAAHDLEAFLALYDDAVVVHDSMVVEAIDGITAWREQVAMWFASIADGDRNVADVADLAIWSEGDLATATGRVRYAIVEPDGSERYGMWNRLTWVLRRTGAGEGGADDGGWRIVHEHTSVPLDPGTMTPQLG